MVIRFMAESDDLLVLSDIYEQSWKFAYRGIIPQAFFDSIPSGRWADSFTRETLKTLCLLENQRIVGTASICKSRWAEYPDFGEIVSIYLLPEVMGRGYGAQLLRRCVAELRKMGHERILFWVLAENARARRFYEKNGFSCADVYREDNIGGRNLQEVMYHLNLRGNHD